MNKKVQPLLACASLCGLLSADAQEPLEIPETLTITPIIVQKDATEEYPHTNTKIYFDLQNQFSHPIREVEFHISGALANLFLDITRKNPRVQSAGELRSLFNEEINIYASNEHVDNNWQVSSRGVSFITVSKIDEYNTAEGEIWLPKWYNAGNDTIRLELDLKDSADLNGNGIIDDEDVIWNPHRYIGTREYKIVFDFNNSSTEVPALFPGLAIGPEPPINIRWNTGSDVFPYLTNLYENVTYIVHTSTDLKNWTPNYVEPINVEYLNPTIRTSRGFIIEGSPDKGFFKFEAFYNDNVVFPSRTKNSSE